MKVKADCLADEVTDGLEALELKGPTGSISVIQTVVGPEFLRFSIKGDTEFGYFSQPLSKPASEGGQIFGILQTFDAESQGLCCYEPQIFGHCQL